jgi:hypothetical protein
MLKRRKWQTIANNFHSKTVLSRESINSVSAASFRRRKKLMNNIHIYSTQEILLFLLTAISTLISLASLGSLLKAVKILRSKKMTTQSSVLQSIPDKREEPTAAESLLLAAALY